MRLNIAVCVKRVPDTGAKLELTPDERAIETRNLGFTISPHEECAVEEAIRQIEQHGGTSLVLTLGPEDAIGQLRDSLARGIDKGLLLETDGNEWDPSTTAKAIVDAIQAQQANGENFDLILFGNESADAGNYQVGVRVAHALGMPWITGIKSLEIHDNKVVAKREISEGWEVFELSMPAMIAVKEGINLPRHPSLRSTMKSKSKPVDRVSPEPDEFGLEMIKLRAPAERESSVKILGDGPQAAPQVVEILKELEAL